MILSCGHMCQKSLNECLQCLRNRIESQGIRSDEKIRILQSLGLRGLIWRRQTKFYVEW
jgi:hypothetical protein